MVCASGTAHAAFTEVEKQLLIACEGSKVGLGASKQAIDLFIRQQPSSPVGPYLLARFFRFDGQPTRAFESLSTSGAAVPQVVDPETKALRGAILRERYAVLDSLDQQVAAEAELRAYQAAGYDKLAARMPGESSDPEDAKVDGDLFECLLKQGKLKAAASVLAAIAPDPAIATTRQQADDLNRRARLLFRQDASDPKVLDLYREAVSFFKGQRQLDAGLLATAAFHERRNGHFAEANALQKSVVSMGGPQSLHLMSLPLADWALANLRWDDAIPAYALSWAQLAGRYAYIRENMELDLRLSVTQFYLLHGNGVDAMGLSSGLVEKPLRNFASTNSLEFWLAGACLTRSQVLRLRDQSLAAAAADAPLASQCRVAKDRLCIKAELTSTAMQFRRSLLVQLAAPVPPRDFLGLAKAPEWLWPEALRLLGAAEARRLIETYPVCGVYGERITPWIRVLLAYGEKDWAGVVRLAPAALAALPADGDSVLRLQVELALAEAYAREGRNGDALPLYTHVLRECPGLFPLMEANLPLRPSPGIPSGLPHTLSAPAGFMLTVVPADSSAKGATVRYTLAAADGTPLREVVLPQHPEPGVSAYEALFVGPRRLTESEKASLGGSAPSPAKK